MREADRDDAPAALLTNAQRKYLRGSNEYRPSVERDVRQRIRERLRAAILDLNLVLSEFDLDDIDKALAEPDESEWPAPAYPPVANAMPALAALIYLRHRDDEVAGKETHDGWKTEMDVDSGIKRALAKMGVEYSDVRVNIHVERGKELEELADVEDLVSLSKQQLTQLHQSDMIDSDQFSRVWMAKKKRSDDTDE